MKCDECKKRPATVHITKIVNGEKTLMHLCEQCAKEKNIFSVSFNFDGEPLSMQKFLASFFEPMVSEFREKSQPLSCNRCGLTFPRFTQIGRFGCSNCYEAFKGQLDPMLRRLHGKTYHVGKVPRRTGGRVRIKSEIERLKRELQEAVNAEEYERAAQLRDKIRELEQKLGRN
ncbi:UvrB/UvrC motif-containing protein [Thermosediminibacter litoriperuensis]|uniref:Protein arginine kinase activator n=1 Tax=Thermosediminibacter litoriperuensis TaxID=291989 RepID=A0A5S5AGN7_9FIRM|nr:UvrB/UvrC motif-containing protein [Thermosediminibacter litoriperuensis]TYP48159.1 protein arginine kinase activator [Thermosediminibacter litoriperuensis]